MMEISWQHLVKNKVAIFPLITFRILFGFLMSISLIRFWLNGWITDQFVTPTFHFKQYGLEWITCPSPIVVHLIFAGMIICAICIAFGFFYRMAIISFFLAFTYVELIDLTNYLNHYYFISLISFIMIWLPAHRLFSLDEKWRNIAQAKEVSAWQINGLKFQIGILYFFAGVAKLNSDWLLHALPLKLWLPIQSQLPLVGQLFQYEQTAYILSWAGALFDLSIFFVLISKKLRPIGYLMVVGFHLMTWLLFPIGMFPFFMIGLTLIFFSAHHHKAVLQNIGLKLRDNYQYMSNTSPMINAMLICFIAIQLLMPLRYLAYPEKLFWTEQGYRYSWRVMLMEKAGLATFSVTDPISQQKAIINNSDWLTPNQEKMMSTQPDFILQYAHYLAETYQEEGWESPIVQAEVYVSLQGEPSKLYFDPKINLATIKDSFTPKTWLNKW